jgi:hypothetical protein
VVVTDRYDSNFGNVEPGVVDTRKGFPQPANSCRQQQISESEQS